MSPPRTPALIGLDWGTSSLRAHLIAADGGVLETRRQPWGILHLPEGGFPAAYRGMVGDWRDRWPALPALAAGMIGSRQGWHEVAYVPCPADTAAIAAGLESIDVDGGRLAIVPGVVQRGHLPDVLRGEETQILGALALDPALAADSLLVLPGTHSKWVTVRAGRLERFSTHMTGELFAVLRDHSILGRPARESIGAGNDCDEAFLRGLRTARESGAAGVAGRLFSTRSLFLVGDLPAEATLHYLSGLLVGEEIRGGLAARNNAAPRRLAVIGDPGLCARYRLAFTEFAIDSPSVIDDTAAAGLWRIAVAAGLVAAAPAGPASSPRAAPHA
jgi:2-dehydro-3-deoxygalactonokinase